MLHPGTWNSHLWNFVLACGFLVFFGYSTKLSSSQYVALTLLFSLAVFRICFIFRIIPGIITRQIDAMSKLDALLQMNDDQKISKSLKEQESAISDLIDPIRKMNSTGLLGIFSECVGFTITIAMLAAALAEVAVRMFH